MRGDGEVSTSIAVSDMPDADDAAAAGACAFAAPPRFQNAPCALVTPATSVPASSRISLALVLRLTFTISQPSTHMA